MTKATWKITGIVDSVDANNSTITFWLDGFDELQTVPLSPEMPSWLLRPGAGFLTRIPRECLRTEVSEFAGFEPNPEAELSIEEMFAEFDRALADKGQHA
jgi:hypothetical protein